MLTPRLWMPRVVMHSCAASMTTPTPRGCRVVWMQRAIYTLSRRHPEVLKGMLKLGLRRRLPKGYDRSHFIAPYDPWDQRLCAVPDGDLFKAISEGKASVVTDHIKTFTETGIELESGRTLEADIIITATGLDLQPFGGLQLTVDGTAFEPTEHLAYKGVMLSDVPNFAFAVGYTNSSWTLKVDLVCEYLCKLMSEMDRRGVAVAVPVCDEPNMETRPLLDFGAGYVKRAIDRFPRQGDRDPWQVIMSYDKDVEILRRGAVDDGIIRFSSPVRERVAA